MDQMESQITWHVLYYKPQRTGYRQNYSNNFGVTATFSVPLDWGPSTFASGSEKSRALRAILG